MVLDLKWVKRLEALSNSKANEPEGDGWFTALDFQKESGIGITRSHRLLRAGLADNSIELYKGSVWSSTQQQLVRRVWYRFIKPKKDKK
jgi:hypothetical protein